MPIALGIKIENDYAKLFFQPPLKYGYGIGHIFILKLKQPACWVKMDKNIFIKLCLVTLYYLDIMTKEAQL